MSRSPAPGVVLKAEIVDTARADDPAYREVAVSARNAVLLSSPLSLPAGHYQGVMDMVLYLNPKRSHCANQGRSLATRKPVRLE